LIIPTGCSALSEVHGNLPPSKPVVDVECGKLLTRVQVQSIGCSRGGSSPHTVATPEVANLFPYDSSLQSSSLSLSSSRIRRILILVSLSSFPLVRRSSQLNFKKGLRQDGTSISDVELPPWAQGDARRFIEMHAEVSADRSSRTERRCTYEVCLGTGKRIRFGTLAPLD
jgi:hypothetical protein